MKFDPHDPLDNVIDLLDDEVEDIKIAAAAMARHWKAAGLGDAVRGIGPDQGFEGARIFLAQFYAARHRRLAAKHARDGDAIQF